jgi:hypothetical protein
VVLQLTALALAGAVTVDRFVVWAPIDEAQHFAYVEELAEDGRLPWLGRDTVSNEVLAISRSTCSLSKRARVRERPGRMYERPILPADGHNSRAQTEHRADRGTR